MTSSSEDEAHLSDGGNAKKKGQEHVIVRTASEIRRNSGTNKRSDPLRSSLRRLRQNPTSPTIEAPSWGGVYIGPSPDNPATNIAKMPKSGKVKCHVCAKKCAGDILKADDKYFHIACFACATCHRPLSEVGYFVHEGKYYCPGDYHAQFGARCTVCSDFVEGNVVQCLGKSFHQRCFTCDRCKQPFPKDQKVTWTGKEHLCKRCVTVPVATVKPTLQHNSMDKPASPPPTSSPTACAECGQLIHSGQVLLALGAHWHIWCFKCSTCGSVLHGEYLAKDGHPYCIRDYNAAFGVPCHECNKFITGKVLQAGGYQFHPTCATCCRCGEHFGDGEEMCMQGDEIWHSKCDNVKPPERIVHSKNSLPRFLQVFSKHGHTKSPRSSYAGPKYTQDFGKHLTYMYLLPELDMGYLKHPISPHPPQSQQFHTPQGPVKIRKSRCSILKTGMQKLAESLEDERPRPKSPHMDNEEPIELSHYPGGSVPDPEKMPAIERDDFPAPPYPYAVEELRRRLSHSDLEDEDEDEVDGGPEVDKLDRAEEELKKIDHDSSLVHIFVQNLEERQKKVKLPLHWDPRSAARTPSAKALPHLRCRYESPINASPSRYENRPKPWMFWQDRSATTTIPYFQGVHPKPGYSLQPKSSTLPAQNGYFDVQHYGDMNTTRDSMYSDSTMISNAGTLPPSGIERFQPAHHMAGTVLRTSLPDMTKPPQIFSYKELITANKKLPEDIDRCHLERHLTKNEFENLFHMTPLEFYKLPEWKRINLKRRAKLF